MFFHCGLASAAKLMTSKRCVLSPSADAGVAGVLVQVALRLVERHGRQRAGGGGLTGSRVSKSLAGGRRGWLAPVTGSKCRVVVERLVVELEVRRVRERREALTRGAVASLRSSCLSRRRHTRPSSTPLADSRSPMVLPVCGGSVVALSWSSAYRLGGCRSVAWSVGARLVRRLHRVHRVEGAG